MYYKSLNLNWVGIVVHLYLNWKFSDLSSYEVTWHFSQGKISWYTVVSNKQLAIAIGWE